MLAGNDFDQQVTPHLARRVIGCAQCLDLLALEVRIVVGMIKAQHLDAMVDRPLDQL